MDRCVYELLEFYQRDLREHKDGQALLARLGITSMEVIEHFKLGYCSGRALGLASDRAGRQYQELGLVTRAREIFSGCIVFPVTAPDGGLVDLLGLRFAAADRRSFFWQDPPQGLLGVEALKAFPEIILADGPYYALQARQHGFANVVVLRRPEELEQHVDLLSTSGLQCIYVLSRKHVQRLVAVVRQLKTLNVCLKPVFVDGHLARSTFDPVGKPRERVSQHLQILSCEPHRIVVAMGELRYRVDLGGVACLRVHIRAERAGRTFLDKVDLASATTRQRFSKACAMALIVSSLDVEAHLEELTQYLDKRQEESDEVAPRVLSCVEEEQARRLLQRPDLLEYMSASLEQGFGIVGEEANRKLALLVAASRLLDKPLGCIIRGAASSGKSSLIQAVARLLPERQVLNFSRITPQALYFLPRESLLHSVMVVDEYAGLADSEYSLRPLMSNQMLSLAISLREGGGLPRTKTVQIPAKVAVLVSTTSSINDENLSRLVELRMDTSPKQTQRVLARLAQGAMGGPNEEILRQFQDANQMLRPCHVDVPFSDRLAYGGGAVLARRQFSHVMGLVAAHAALYQAQRTCEKLEDGRLRVKAQKEDYAAIHALISHVVVTVEESLSPVALELLQALHQDGRGAYTVRDVMDLMNWSYSSSYRRLGELAEIRLLVPDQNTNGVQRVYEVAPYARLEQGSLALPEPQAI